MKATQKLLSLALALATVLALGGSALADETAYSITIKSAPAGHTYEAYQIFSGDLYDAGAAAEPEDTGSTVTHSKVLSNIVWGSGVDTATDSTAFAAAFPDSAAVTADSLKTTDDVQAFAKKVAPFLAAPSGTSTGSQDADAATFTYTISGLSAGYYLVKDKDNTLTGKDDFYTAYIMKVVADVEATPKGDKPTLEKNIYDATDGHWNADHAGFQIGDTINFRTVSRVPNISGYKNYTYIIHDTMTAGLTPKIQAGSGSASGVTIKVNDAAELSDTYYTVTIDANDPNSFTVSIKIKDAIDANVLQADNRLYMYYSAELNGSANYLFNNSNDNTAYLEYSNDPNGTATGKTSPDKVHAWTLPVNVKKVNGANKTEVLQGAKFVLSTRGDLKISDLQCTADGTPTVTTDLIAFYVDEAAIASYEVASPEMVEAGQDISYVIEVGDKMIAGLGEKTYYLYETKAPAGYNLLAEPVAFTFHVPEAAIVPGNWPWITVGSSTEKVTDLTLVVENNSGATLPETGGIGTTIFYAVGGLLVVGAGVLLVTRKRMSKSDH